VGILEGGLDATRAGGIVKAEEHFPAELASVTAARHFVGGVLAQLSTSQVDGVELMVSELAANAVRHAHSEFDVSVSLEPDTLTIAVTDYGGGQPALRDTKPEELEGRGLQFVASFSREWGVSRTEGVAGKAVWFRLFPMGSGSGPTSSVDIQAGSVGI
jgi:anti-sigma regulatory factor (Ser/Thr protein kinase)